MLEKVRALARRNRQFILYVIIGCSGVMLDVIVFLILFNWFLIDKNIATIISTFVGMTNNFIWNSLFNFKITTNPFRRLLQFYAVGSVGIVLTIGLFRLFTDTLGADANMVKIGSLIVVLTVQFILNKYWTFR